MGVAGWRYYNHGAIPTVPPHENPDMGPLENKSIWKIGRKVPLLARWTTEFDCGYETNWWYIIKDTPFDISQLKAKRRYEVNKGIKYFDVRKIDPCDYKEELYSVQVAAFSAYPEKYRPTVDKQAMFSKIDQWGQYVVFGAFHRESGELSGYAFLMQTRHDYVDFNVLKTKPEQEKFSVNAALVAGILQYFHDFLLNGGMICDGARSIHHETAFQDYLEKYFGFRKAYCHLHVAYNPKIKWLIKLLFPVRKCLLKLDMLGMVHQINSVLKMEALVREKYE